jgi:ferredoxin
MCSESRCRQCRDSRCADKAPELEKGFTYGRYQEWRQRKDLKSSRAPVIDIRECKGCETCVVLCPDVFKRNSETDIIEVVVLSEYPEEGTEKAVSMCPRDCITWQDVP